MSKDQRRPEMSKDDAKLIRHMSDDAKRIRRKTVKELEYTINLATILKNMMRGVKSCSEEITKVEHMLTNEQIAEAAEFARRETYQIELPDLSGQALNLKRGSKS